MNQNSVLIGRLKLWLHRLYRAYEKSVSYRILHQIYLFFSHCWSKSAIVRLVGKSCRQGRGVLWRFYQFLFSLPQAFGRAVKLDLAVRQSLICGMAYRLLMGVLQGNTRVLGVFLSSFSIGGIVTGFATGRQLSMYLLVPLALGVALLLFQKNLTAEILQSKILRFIADSFALEGSWQPLAEPVGGRFGALLLGLAGGCLETVHPLLGGVAVVAVIGMLAVLYRPFLGVAVTIAAAPFLPTMALAGMVLWTMFSLILYSIMHPEFSWKLDWTGAGILAFLLITWLSIFSSYAPANSLMVAAITSVFVMFYFCVINTASSSQKVLLLLKLFAISGCAVAIYGILQYVMGWGVNVTNTWLDEEMFEDVKLRVYSTLENPNVLGEYLLLVGFVCCGLMCNVKREWQKIVYGGMLIAIFLCLILTQSRGCWLGLMVGAALFVTLTCGRLWGFLPLGLVLLPFVLPQSIINRFSSIGNLEDSSSSYRVFIWLGTIRMLRDFWISGVGMGELAYNSVYPFYSYNAIVAPHSHNLYLQMMVHSGLPALLLFLGIVWMTVRALSDCGRTGPSEKRIAAAVGCGLAAYLFQGIFDYVFYNYRVMLIFWAVVGMAMALYHAGREKTYDQSVSGFQ